MQLEPRPLRSWPFLLAGLVVVGAITMAGVWYYQAEAVRLRLEEQGELAAVGESKVHALIEWRTRLLRDAKRGGRSVLLADFLSQRAHGSVSTELQQRTRLRLELDREEGEYSEVLLLAPDGQVVLSTAEESHALDATTSGVVAEAHSTLAPTLSDLHRHTSGHIAIDAVAAVVGAKGEVLGTVLLCQDAHTELYPLLESWPDPSETAETHLVERVGDEVLYLDELARADSVPPLVSLTQREASAVRAVLGERGVVEGTNRKHTAVLSYLHPIEGSPWFLVIKVDLEETLAVTGFRFKLVSAAVVTLVGLVLLAVFVFDRHRKARFYQLLALSERDRRLAQEHLRTTLYSIDDGVIGTDTDAKVRVLNRVAERLTGWTESEALGRPLSEVFALIDEESREPTGARAPQELLLVGRDGVERPISASSTPVCDEQGNELGAALVFRDQTEDRKKERHLEQLNVALRTIRSVNQLIVHEGDPQRLIERACMELVKAGRTACQAWILLTDERGKVTLAASMGFEESCDPAALSRRGLSPSCLGALDHEGLMPASALRDLCERCPLAKSRADHDKMVARLGKDGQGRGIIGLSSLSQDNAMFEDPSLFAELVEDLDFGLRNIEGARIRALAQRQAEEAAADFKSLAENVPSLIARFDSQLKHTFVNPAAARAGIVSAQEYIGKSISETGVPADTARVWEDRIRSVFESGRPLDVVDSFDTPEGKKHFHTILVPERAEGSVRTVLSVAHDITERIEFEEALRRSEESLNLALETNHMGAWNLNLLNHTSERSLIHDQIFGYDTLLPSWSYERFFEHVLPEDRDEVRQQFGLAIATRGDWDFECRIRRQDGEVRWISAVGGHENDDQGQATWMAGLVRDITERKQAEAERQKLQVQLAQSDRMASIGTLAAGVAHEINNPLSYVLYNLESVVTELPELVEQASVSSPNGAHLEPALKNICERLQEALTGTERITSITRSLGTFSHIESSEVTSVNVQTSIEHAISMASNELKYRARLVADFSPVPNVLATEGKLSQVFLNLLINAAHAIEEGHVANNEVRVRTWGEGDSVFAEVGDTGCGIRPEHQSKIFEPFFTTKGVGVGTGLGLSICKNIITSFHGEIGFTSERGVGTRFQIELPAQPQSWEAPVIDEEQAPKRPTARGRLLVVDDEDVICRVIKRMLRPHEVVTVSSGEEGRSLLESDRAFDLIVCDLMMAKLSGMELHAWLTKQDPGLAQRMVFMTGAIFTPGAAEYLARAGNRCVEKPFDTAKFKALVDELVVAGQAARETKC